MNALATLLSYGLPYSLQIEAEMQLAAAARGEPVDPAGVVQIEGDAVYLRYDQVTIEDNPGGMTVRYYLGAIAVMWRRVLGARLTLMPGQHRLEFSRHPGRVKLPFGLRQA